MTAVFLNLSRFSKLIILFVLAPLVFPVMFFSDLYYRENIKISHNFVNPFYELDDWFNERKKLLKKRTRLDFFDWSNLTLFILGTTFIFIMWQLNLMAMNYGDLLTSIILWFTGISVLQYTKETYFLKEVTTKNLNLERENALFQKAPFVIANFADPNCFYLKNVGRGVAKNVRWKIVDRYDGCPPKTVITIGDVGYTKVCLTPFSNLKPSVGLDYQIEIEYEDTDGVLYFTRLQSGETDDGFIVTKYERKNRNSKGT